MSAQQTIINIIKKVLNKNQTIIDHNTTPADINNWDSLHHVLILNEIEKTFGIKFELDEMLNMNSVKDIIQVVETKTNGNS